MKYVISFILAVPLALPAAAQQQQASEVIVVTASAVPESIEVTPAAVTVVEREEIERRAALEVADLLREVPGITVSRTGSSGKATTLFVRGGSSKQALVLWNGVPMNNPYFSGYNMGQLSAAGVERIEVVRGPFSALYGSEAVSGVINVLSSPPRSGGTVDVSAGGNGLLNLTGSGAIVEEGWTAHATVERRRDDGFSRNDDFASTSLLGGATLHPGERLSVGVIGRRSSYDLGIPQAPDASFSRFVPSPYRRENGVETQFVLPVHFDGERIDYDLRLSESRRDDDFADPDGPFGPESSSTQSRMRRFRGTTSAVTRFGTITGGIEYGRDRVDHSSNFAEIDARERTNRSAFAENRLTFTPGESRLELTAGIRHDHYETFGSELTPRIAGAWLRGGHKLRAAYGEAFRAPAIGELYFPFGGNPELGAERSRNYEVGYDRFGTGESFSITLFRSRYDGLIAFGQAFMFENIQAASAQGLELSGKLSAGSVDFSASYAFVDTEDAETGDELLRRPRHSGSIGATYAAGAFDTTLVVAHKGSRSDVTDLFPWGVVMSEAHTTADVTVRYALGNVIPYVRIENLTDVRYEEVFGYASPRRRLIAGVRYVVR